MSGLTSALRMGITGLGVSQSSLATISHNVVNANTPGYSRQIAQPTAVSTNGFGNGVALADIQRVSDRFITLRAVGAASDAQYAETRKGYLDTLEGVMTGATAEGGLETITAKFFESVSQLSNDPANSALKRNLVQQAQVLAQTIRDIDTDLGTTAADADSALTAELVNANQLMKDISDLNTQIAQLYTGSSSGGNANDLLDARDSKIADLAKIVKLQVSENGDNGAVRITLENGRRLVDSSGYVQLKRTPGTPYQGIAVQSILVDGSLSNTVLPIDIATLTSGKMKALVDVRDTLVTNLKAQVETLADTLRTEFNSISSQGSSVPPVRTLTSGNTADVAGTGTNLYSLPEFAGLAGATFHLSVTNSLGQPALTTVGGTAITLPGAGPFSLTDLATLINSNATIGNGALGGSNGVTATALVDGSGNPYLQLQAANSSQRIVLANASGNALGLLGMNNVITGTGAANIDVSATLLANPELLPTGRMRPTDGGLSNLDNQNALAMAALADTKVAFAASGGLGAQNATMSGYASQMVSNLSITINDAKDRVTFTTNIANQLENLRSQTSGVNVDEELAQMLVYQNSFQASARIVSVVSQLLDELVNIVR